MLFGNIFAQNCIKKEFGPKGGGVRISSDSLGSITRNHLMESEKIFSIEWNLYFCCGIHKNLQTLITF